MGNIFPTFSHRNAVIAELSMTGYMIVPRWVVLCPLNLQPYSIFFFFFFLPENHLLCCLSPFVLREHFQKADESGGCRGFRSGDERSKEDHSWERAHTRNEANAQPHGCGLVWNWRMCVTIIIIKKKHKAGISPPTHERGRTNQWRDDNEWLSLPGRESKGGR